MPRGQHLPLDKKNTELLALIAAKGHPNLKAFAGVAGVGYQTMLGVVSGRVRPRRSTVRKIAQTLGVPQRRLGLR